jgi:hypothetical protein
MPLGAGDSCSHRVARRSVGQRLRMYVEGTSKQGTVASAGRIRRGGELDRVRVRGTGAGETEGGQGTIMRTGWPLSEAGLAPRVGWGLAEESPGRDPVMVGMPGGTTELAWSLLG